METIFESHIKQNVKSLKILRDKSIKTNKKVNGLNAEQWQEKINTYYNKYSFL
jgi:hypothetical protein